MLINDDELDRLEGTDYMLTSLYMYLRRHMDFATGVTGIKRGISYQSLSEALYIEPRPGVKGGSPHRSTMRRALDQLEKTGLVTRSNNPDLLIFKLPFAQADNNVRKKADTNPTPQPDRGKATPDMAHSIQADRGKKAKADTPPLSDKTILTTTTDNCESRGVNTDASRRSELIFHRSIDEATQQGMFKTLDGFDAVQQQEMLDELAGYIDHKQILTTSSAVLFGIAKACRQGRFVPAHAPQVKKARAKREAEKTVSIEKPNKLTDRTKIDQHRSNMRLIVGGTKK